MFSRACFSACHFAVFLAILSLLIPIFAFSSLGSTTCFILCSATLFLEAGFSSVAILSDVLVYVMF
jgi:hypothetical protein